MTYRERVEARLERRQQWAASRDAKVAACNAVAEPYRGDIAFNTQPGYIPERARVIRAQERGFEHSKMAQKHLERASGIKSQLDRSIYSDDDNAIEALEARIKENEAVRDKMKLTNKLYKKGDAAGLAAIGLDLEKIKARLATMGAWEGKAPFLPYETTNLGARIRADKRRIEEVKTRQKRTEATRSAGGILIEGAGQYCRVTFEDKPERELLDALKAAGFYWHGGSWQGERAKLPEGLEMGGLTP